MELKTIQTERVPVRYYEGGAGRPLVFLHGAGGLDMDLGFLGRAGAEVSRVRAAGAGLRR